MLKPLGRRSKHFRFKLRATKDLPTREFAIEFTPGNIIINKIGCSNFKERISWNHMLGHMLIHESLMETPDLTDWRGFLVEQNRMSLPVVQFEVRFGKRGLAVRKYVQELDEGSPGGPFIVWPWRVIIGFAVLGGGR